MAVLPVNADTFSGNDWANEMKHTPCKRLRRLIIDLRTPFLMELTGIRMASMLLTAWTMSLYLPLGVVLANTGFLARTLPTMPRRISSRVQPYCVQDVLSVLHQLLTAAGRQRRHLFLWIDQHCLL